MQSCDAIKLHTPAATPFALGSVCAKWIRLPSIGETALCITRAAAKDVKEAASSFDMLKRATIASSTSIPSPGAALQSITRIQQDMFKKKSE